MASALPHERTDDRSERDQTTEAPSTDVFGLLNDEYVREILRALQEGSRPARELYEASSASRATVYRRLDRLEDADIVGSRVTLHPDGHHRKEFHVTVEEITIRLDGELTVTVVGADDD